MTPAILALIEGIIATVPEAIQLWNTLKPIISDGREPTEEEWATLNAQRDVAHAAVQAG